jgi:hypothetical protein
MANLNAMFAGCESFMEGDVEINNDVTMPDSGEALEAETVAEDVGAEGGEIAGEAETADTKAEAANMVFDQVLNMYRHVKQNGIDRTFLSLYNSQGQLNSMIGYKFPSCESMDSVGSPRSSSSQAFIAAMESDGIFTKIWNWIKEQWAKIVNFFRKVMDWFREACGNLDLRVGKLLKYYRNSANKKYKDVKDKSVRYVSKTEVDRYTKAFDKVNDEIKQIATVVVMPGSLGDVFVAVSALTKSISEGFSRIANKVKDRAKDTNGFGRTKDSDDKDGHGQLKQYIDRFNKDAIEPYAEAISELGSESDDLDKIQSKGDINIGVNSTKIVATGPTLKTTDDADTNVKEIMIAMLETCATELQNILKQRQALDSLKRANDQAEQQAEQLARLATGESRGYDATKDAKESTLAAVKMNSVFVKVLGLREKLIAKLCKVAASYQACVSANGAATNP